MSGGGHRWMKQEQSEILESHHQTACTAAIIPDLGHILVRARHHLPGVGGVNSSFFSCGWGAIVPFSGF